MIKVSSTAYLGDEFSKNFEEKIEWLRANFVKDQYKIIEEAFIISEFYVEFADDKYMSLYLMKFSR